jgi:hypothetical protein
MFPWDEETNFGFVQYDSLQLSEDLDVRDILSRARAGARELAQEYLKP